LGGAFFDAAGYNTGQTRSAAKVSTAYHSEALAIRLAIIAGMDARLALATIISLLLNEHSPAAIEATRIAVTALSDPPAPSQDQRGPQFSV
jgi:hypothetical protein